MHEKERAILEVIAQERHDLRIESIEETKSMHRKNKNHFSTGHDSSGDGEISKMKKKYQNSKQKLKNAHSGNKMILRSISIGPMLKQNNPIHRVQKAAAFFTEVIFQQLSPLHNFVEAFCTR